MTLIINPVYDKLVPTLSKVDYDNLKNSIEKNGQWIPILINENNEVLDGHNRYDICQELGIKVKTAVRTFDNKLLEKKFVIECNLHRRHLNDFQKSELGIPLLEINQQLAKENQKLHHTRVSSYEEKQNSNKETAKEIGVSKSTFERAKKVIEQSPEEIKQKLREGKNGYTINKAYQHIQKKERKEKRQQETRENQVTLPDTISLYNQDFRTAPIQKNSVSLIWTDPPYDEKSLPLYEYLAIQAAKVLKDGGSLMCYAGHYAIDRIITMMKNHGLKYQWQMVVIHTGHKASQHGPRVFVGYKPILWFVKGKYEGDYIHDTVTSTPPDKSEHEWAQSTTESDYYIEHLTIENEIVYDPFMGSGTTGISAKKLNRQFIGCESNDKDENNYFEIAERRITNAP